MAAREIENKIYSVGAIDWDRTLFDALIPLPHGTSYNSYLIQGSEKTALIDTVEPTKFDQLKKSLVNLDVKKIDYIISNHAEQDHSGSIPAMLELYPGAKVVTNSKCRDFLIQLLHLPEEKFLVINDRDTLSLGDKTLEFILAPWVHWPETMFTYLQEDKILFSGDFLGSHLATSDLFAEDQSNVLREAKRYYAEIMMPFAKSIRKHLQTVDDLNPAVIAPTHGPVYDNPQFILNAYKDWVSEDAKSEVVLLYVSMHGSTEQMAHYFLDVLMQRGVSVQPFNMMSADIGEIALAMVDAATVVFASPAVLMGPHPNMVSAVYLINSLKPKTKYAAVIGSYGWGNKMVEQITSLMSGVKAEFLPPVLTKGLPSDQDFKELERLADAIVEKHADL
ncbi:MAG: FprA family A-type flavoprotein [Calditrichia bacterium]